MTLDPSEPASGSVLSDFASPESVVRAFYESNSGGPGVAQDWSRFRGLFLPSARIVAMVRDLSGIQRTIDQSVDEYTVSAETRLQKRAFSERELAHRSVRYGAMVHRWSAYEARHGVAPQETIVRGINSFQLLEMDGRWVIAHVLWTNDQTAGSVPAEYLWQK